MHWYQRTLILAQIKPEKRFAYFNPSDFLIGWNNVAENTVFKRPVEISNHGENHHGQCKRHPFKFCLQIFINTFVASILHLSIILQVGDPNNDWTCTTRHLGCPVQNNVSFMDVTPHHKLQLVNGDDLRASAVAALASNETTVPLWPYRNGLHHLDL